MNLSYDEIRRIYRLEKNTSKLVEVEDDFFSSLNEFMKEQKKEYLKSLKNLSVSKARDFSNLKRMVDEIFSIREKKLLNRALIASRTGEVTEQKIAKEEKKTFNDLLEVLNRHRASLNEVFESKASENKAFVSSEKKVLIKILKDIPSFVGTDMKEYGPFSSGQKVSLPSKTAKLLVSKKMAEKIG